MTKLSLAKPMAHAMGGSFEMRHLLRVATPAGLPDIMPAPRTPLTPTPEPRSYELCTTLIAANTRDCLYTSSHILVESSQNSCKIVI